jgi:DNA-binding transcriptional MerR regulator
MNCSQCGTGNADDSSYCRSCGARLIAPALVHCPQCDFSNLADSQYCSRCGTALVALAPTQPPQKLTSVDAPVTGVRKPDWTHDYATPQSGVSTSKWAQDHSNAPTTAKGLIPTHELLRMANAVGVDIDYSTLRFWQKRGLVSNPLRGPVETGRGTRGYYDASLIDRLAFIREIQKTYSMGLETIRDELSALDEQIRQRGEPAQVYHERLAVLQSQREVDSKRTLLSVLGKVMGIPPEEISVVIVRKKDGQTIRLVADRVAREPIAELPRVRRDLSPMDEGDDEDEDETEAEEQKAVVGRRVDKK